MTNMFYPQGNSGSKSVRLPAVVSFFVTLTLCVLLVAAMVLNRSGVERLTMEQLILEKSIKVSDSINKLLYKTETLATIVKQNGGTIEDFEQIAVTIVDDPAILNILIAPDGVVSGVYPVAGNEAVLGLDFFSEGAGNKEAALAKETGQLVLGGPFEAVQGGQVLVGRLPVYIERGSGEPDFWGLVSVTLKYPQALDGAGLSELQIQGFAYEIWRINPDDGERQIITSSGHSYNENVKYVERELSIANAHWQFRILPVRAWYEFPETWTALIISICVSFLVASVVQTNRKLNILKDELVSLSISDPLTGAYNRRYFMETAATQIDRVRRNGGEAYIIMMDLDCFKSVNDCHGHQVGDAVLREISGRISKTLRSYDLFARYGGEEFIVFVSEITKASVIQLAERLRLEVASMSLESDGKGIAITTSLGIAPAVPGTSLDSSISLADKALYKAKDEGRNRAVFYNGAEYESAVDGVKR